MVHNSLKSRDEIQKIVKINSKFWIAENSLFNLTVTTMAKTETGDIKGWGGVTTGIFAKRPVYSIVPHTEIINV